MNLGDEVDLEDYVSRPDKISAAEVGSFLTSESENTLFCFNFILFSRCHGLLIIGCECQCLNMSDCSDLSRSRNARCA